LTSGPDLGAWPDYWVSVEFLHSPSLGRGRVAPPPPPTTNNLQSVIHPETATSITSVEVVVTVLEQMYEFHF